MPKKELDNNKQSNNNKFSSFITLKELICLFLRQWRLNDINDSIQIFTIQSIEEDYICLLSFFLCFEIVASFRSYQLLSITSNFIFSNNDTLSSWVTIKKQVAKNIIEQKS